MRRRYVLSLVSITLVSGGCVELESAAFGGDEDADGDEDDEDDDEPIEDEELERLREMLDAAEVDILELTREDDGFFLEMQTSGNVDEDINRVASSFSSVATEVEGDLSVRIEDRGLTEATFDIQHEWALQHANDEMSDGDYLREVEGTME